MKIGRTSYILPTVIRINSNKNEYRRIQSHAHDYIRNKTKKSALRLFNADF